MLGSSAFRMSVTPGGALAGPWVKNPLWSTARAVPSLDLPFADTKSLVDAVTGQSLVTFTRASSATYVGSDGVLRTAAVNEPRFGHNPTTGESLGLLVEEQRTNLLLQSNGFDTTWTNTNSSRTAAIGTAPDGTNTAWELKDTLDATSATHSLFQSVSFVSGTSYTLSVFAKAGTLPCLGLVYPGAAFGSTLASRYNLLTGTVASTPAGATSSIESFPNGWYRCSITLTATATASASISLRTGTVSATTYQGDGTGTILIWGAQLEAGAFPTSYIPTTTATATRSADVASITGTAFSSWYRQDEGTVFFDGINPATGTTGFAVSDGSIDNRLQMSTGTNSRIARVTSGGTTQTANSVAYTYGTSQRFALSYVINSINFANAGVLGAEATSATIPTVNQMKIGANPTGGSPLNSTIKQIVFWPQRLPNSTIQALTQ